MSQSIKVVVRIRPINSKQLALNCHQIISVDEPNNQLTIFKPQQPQNIKSFAYDSVFSANSQQCVVYAKTAYALVQNILQGYNGTIFAYGQTGCGKTHSMVGKLDNQQLQGIIPRSFGHILNTISQTKNREYLIRCSFIQIYNEEVRDLLGKDIKRGLEIKQSPDKGVFIKDLSSNAAKTYEQLMQYMNIGNRNRSVGETAMNKDSSRSHLLFMLYLESADLSIPQQNRKYIASKLNLVDLAGSERINKTGAQGDRLQQAKNINLSLSALGNVISALVDGKSHHIPYRDSKLTRLLQDSLGGNTKTVMIANCSPADYNFDQTLSTLRYASRAKFIKNKPIINQDPKDALLKQYANQIRKLKQMLTSGQCPSSLVGTQPNATQYTSKMRQKQQELANQKQQTRQLQQRLQALQKQYVSSDNVKINHKVKQRIKQVRESVLMILPVNVDLVNSQGVKDIKICTPHKPYTHNSMHSNGHVSSSFAPKQNYTSSQACKQTVKYYKGQIKSLENEVKDIEHQNQLDKQLILNDIRHLSKENKLLQGIVNILLSPKELEKIKNRIEALEKQQNSHSNRDIDRDRDRYRDRDRDGFIAGDGHEHNFIGGTSKQREKDKDKTRYGYNQDKDQYIVPHFWLKQKDVILPKIINLDQLDMEAGMALRNNSNVSNASNASNNKGNKMIVNSSCLSLGKQDHIPDQNNKDNNQQKEKSRSPSKLMINNSQMQELKNNSFAFGKGANKENKKDIFGVKNVIQQARQSYQSPLMGIQAPPTKKCLPNHLEPLRKDMVQKLESNSFSEEKSTQRLEKPRKLEKLANYPVHSTARLSPFGPIQQ